jgi:hypothetical protein
MDPSSGPQIDARFVLGENNTVLWAVVFSLSVHCDRGGEYDLFNRMFFVGKDIEKICCAKQIGLGIMLNAVHRISNSDSAG